MSDVMIEARNLTKTYGAVRALENVSFQVRKGEVLGFLGPNGAGKTTAMKILTCFVAPTEGTATVNGADVWEDSLAVRRSIGYLPESTPLYTEMMVLEYLEFVARMRGLKGADATKALKRAVDETGIGDMLARTIRELSKGYKQRVGLAQALVHTPPVLILDEPMSGLDPNQAIEIRDLITSVGKERTVVLSTHNLAEVQMSCDRVLIISKGRIVADDTPDALVATAGKARFIVEVKKNGKSDSEVRELFAKVKGVDRVRPIELGREEFSFEIVPSGDDDLRGALFQAAVDGSLVMLGLRREGQNLESIFRGLTTGDAPSRKEQRQTAKAEPAEKAEKAEPKSSADADSTDDKKED
jgi:ABC-2 type transport system ATP-binding protein